MEMLFGWIIESSLLILMILGLRKLFMGKIPYLGIYALWLVVLFRFLIPVNLISTPFSVDNLISTYLSSAEKVEVSETEQAGASLGSDISLNILTDSTPDHTVQKAPSEKTIKDSDIDGWQLFQRVWMIISAVLLLWFLSSNFSMVRLLKQKRICYGKRGGIEIYVVSGIKNPCLYGFFRPAIYLPEALFAADSGRCVGTEELEQIITHEYVHYLHKDHIWSALRILLVSIYWFDPVLWLAVSCSKKDAELFCDETVLRFLGEEKRFAYGELLLKLAEKNHWGDFRYSMLSMSRQGKEMEKRIRAISVRRHYSKRVLFPLLLLVILAVGTTCSIGIGPLSEWKAFSVFGNQADSSVSEKDGEQKKAIQTTDSSDSQLPVTSENQEDIYKTQVSTLATDDNNTAGSAEAVYSQTYQEAFENYIRIFTEAVNTGNTDKLQQVLAVDSEVYKQQCAIVKNYYRRGIREKVKSCSLSQVNVLTAEQIQINSEEKIKVFYADATSKLVKQKYRYICECIDGNWVITKMEEIPQTDVNMS